VAAIAKSDVAALASVLDERAFVLGDKPRSVDATVYGFLSNIIDVPMTTSLSEAVRSFPNLVAYAERMRSRYYVQR
jgi:glutathione S-transferase